MELNELAKIRNEADALYEQARRKAQIIATAEFDRVFNETGDPFKAMEASNQVMINLVGRA